MGKPNIRKGGLLQQREPRGNGSSKVHECGYLRLHDVPGYLLVDVFTKGRGGPPRVYQNNRLITLYSVTRCARTRSTLIL